MKLIILKTNLVEALNVVEGSVGNESNLPILKNILLDAEGSRISVSSTNLELAIKKIVAGKVIEAGSVTVPFSVFENIVKNLNTERITLETQDKNLVVLTDNYEASVLTQSPKDFPIIPGVSDRKNLIKAAVGVLREALAKVIVAAQFSDIRPEISGVFLSIENDKKMTLVATDSFRLAEVTLAPGEFKSNVGDSEAIIPLKTAGELLKILNTKKEGDVEIFLDQSQVLFEVDGSELTSRLIDGKFPDYKAIIPKETKNEVVVEREEVMNAIKLTKVFAGRANDISLVVGENKKFLDILSSDSSLGENRYRLPIKLKGEKFKVNFNWRYLMDGLKIYKSKEVILEMSDPDRPVAVKSSSEPLLLYIVMPIKT